MYILPAYTLHFQTIPKGFASEFRHVVIKTNNHVNSLARGMEKSRYSQC